MPPPRSAPAHRPWPAVVVLATVVLMAAAPVAPAQSAPEAETQILLAAIADGNLRAASRRVRTGLREDPASIALREVQLRLFQLGVGYGRTEILAQLRRRRRARAARALLELDPDNAIAHGELGRQALLTVATELLLVKPTGPRATLNQAMTSEGAALDQTGLPLRALRARFAQSRFDLGALRELFPMHDAGGPARAAIAEAEQHLARALRGDDRALDELAQLFVLTEQWPPLDALGEAHGAAVWSGLARYRQGDPEAAAASFARGLAEASAERRARYEALDGLLTPDQAAQRAADPDGFSARYWAQRDPRLLTPVNERLEEHRARVTEADLQFPDEGGAAGARGSIWVRYGPPVRRAVLSDVAYPGDSDEGLYDVWEYDGARYLFRDAERTGDFRLYSPSAFGFNDLATVTQAEGDDTVANDARLRREAPARTGFDLPGRFDLPALASVLPGDGTEPAEVVVAYGVPLAERPRGAAVPLPLDVGAFLLDEAADAPASEWRRRYASLPAGAVVELPGATLWAGAGMLRADRPGAFTAAVEVETGGGRVGAQRIHVTVPPRSDALALSDIVLAYSVEEGAGGPVHRRGLRIVPAPVAAFPGATPFTVYVEVYGLALGADGRTDYAFEAALLPVEDRPALRRVWDAVRGRARAVGVSTASEASGPARTDEQYVILDASQVAAGRFTLVLRVRDRVSGAEVEAERELLIE